MKLYKTLLGVSLTALTVQLPIIPAALAQIEDGPITEREFGIGLPRDHSAILFSDAQYPAFPLKKHQKDYEDIDGMRMKQDVIALSKIAVKYRDETKSQWWGRLPGTSADFEGVQYMLDEFKRLGMKITSVPYVLPEDWRATSFSASYTSGGGNPIPLTTIFPVADTKGTPEGASRPRPSGSAWAPKLISLAGMSRAKP